MGILGCLLVQELPARAAISGSTTFWQSLNYGDTRIAGQDPGSESILPHYASYLASG